MPCSRCGGDGHNIRSCTYRNRDHRIQEVRDRYPSLAEINNMNENQLEWHQLRMEAEQQRLRALTRPPIYAIPSSANPQYLSQEEVDRITERMVDVAIDPPSPKNKKPMKKEIANAFFVCSEETVECCICLDEVKQDSFRLSRCGHNYCKECYDNKLLTKCALCRDENM